MIKEEDIIKIVAKLAEEESRAKSNGRVYTVEQAMYDMRKRETASPENGAHVFARKTFGINTRTKTMK